MARGARCLRREDTRYRWFLEQLVAVRDDERTRLGYVTRVALDAPGELAMALKLWPGSPRIVAVRPTVDRVLRGSAAAGDRCCRRSPDEPASLIVPPRTFAPGRLLRSMDSGPERKFKLTKLLQRGADFERVRVRRDA